MKSPKLGVVGVVAHYVLESIAVAQVKKINDVIDVKILSCYLF